MKLDDLIARGVHDGVVAISDVHGSAKALVSLLGECWRRWKNPYFIFLGDLIDGENSSHVYQAVFSLDKKCQVLRSNHCLHFLHEIQTNSLGNDDRKAVVAKYGVDRLTHFIESLPEFVTYKGYWLSHAPVFSAPNPEWIGSQNPTDLLISSFAQAERAGYDWSGTRAYGGFEQEDLVCDPNYIGVSGHLQLSDVVFHERYYCLDSGVAEGRTLSGFDLNSRRLIQVNRIGNVVRDEPIDVPRG